MLVWIVCSVMADTKGMVANWLEYDLERILKRFCRDLQALLPALNIFSADSWPATLVIRRQTFSQLFLIHFSKEFSLFTQKGNLVPIQLRVSGNAHSVRSELGDQETVVMVSDPNDVLEPFAKDIKDLKLCECLCEPFL